MKRALTLISGAALAFSVAAVQPTRAVTPPNGAVQGTWAWAASGLADGENQASGNLTFDGNGGVTGIVNFNKNGKVCSGMTVTGDYLVNPGKLTGTAAMTVTSVDTSNCASLGDGDTLTIAFSLFNGLNGFNFMEIDLDSPGYFQHDFSLLAGVATHF